MQRTFEPVSRLVGTATVTGDKSISHRALILGAMSAGESTIRGLSDGQDVGSTRSALEQLGVEFKEEPHGHLRVSGIGWKLPAAARLDAGNSGTTMRLLAGGLAGQKGEFEITGDESLSRRPMLRIAEPLGSMGASVKTDPDGTPPLLIRGGGLRSIDYDLPVASAQVKGALLLAGLQADGTTTITERFQSRDHTERLLSWLEQPVEINRSGVQVSRGNLFETAGFDLRVPGDLSSAAFLLVAACLAPGSSVIVENVGLNHTRAGLLDVLGAMGAKLEMLETNDYVEPYGTLRVSHSQLEWTEISNELVPRVIDEIPLMVLAATQAEGVSTIRDAGELRVKESDRISVLAKGLVELGATVEEISDGLVIQGPTKLHGGIVDPEGDHRLAITFAVAGLIASDPVTVTGWECTAISYPAFERDLKSLAG